VVEERIVSFGMHAGSREAFVMTELLMSPHVGWVVLGSFVAGLFALAVRFTDR
jgi:hypothetical protein